MRPHILFAPCPAQSLSFAPAQCSCSRRRIVARLRECGISKVLKHCNQVASGSNGEESAQSLSDPSPTPGDRSAAEVRNSEGRWETVFLLLCRRNHHFETGDSASCREEGREQCVRTLVNDARVELDSDGVTNDLAQEAGRVARGVACAVLHSFSGRVRESWGETDEGRVQC